MKARACILTIGTSLVLVAPAAQAADAVPAVGCSPIATHVTKNDAAASRKALFSPQNSRSLQYAIDGDGAVTGQPVRTTLCTKKVTTTLVTPNLFQVLRNSL